MQSQIRPNCMKSAWLLQLTKQNHQIICQTTKEVNDEAAIGGGLVVEVFAVWR